MPSQQVTGGYSQRLDRYYTLFAGVDNEGGINIVESYDYAARGEDDGREFMYHLTIPADGATAFLGRLAREAQRAWSQAHTSLRRNLAALFAHVWPYGRRHDHSRQQRALVVLLKQLVQQGVLASAASAEAKQNLETLIAWLEQEQIPYEMRPWSY
jgi:hypothetical protein